MEEFNPTIFYTYSVEQLFDFIQRKEVSFEELQELGLPYDKQKALKTLIDTWVDTCAEEEEDFKQACKKATICENLENYKGAIDKYEVYLDKWKNRTPHPHPDHITYCEEEIIRLKESIGVGFNKLKQNLLRDMQERAWHYSPLLMRYLLGKTSVDPEDLENDSSPAGKFLASGQTLTMDDLVEAGLIPGRNPVLQKSVCENFFKLPTLPIEELGDFPKDRTDVYMMGVKGSGKTCALAGIIKQLFDSGEVVYRPQFNSLHQDLCQEYYYKLIEGVRHFKAFEPTPIDTVSFMKLDIGKDKRKPLTFVEMAGEAFYSMADAFARDTWEKLGAKKCLDNTNDKVLCFFVDYKNVISQDLNDSNQQDQDIVLSRALMVLSNDGPDINHPERGCTMSRVKTLAIVVTKSDLMGPNLSFEEREAIAKEYVQTNLCSFVSSLKEQCKIHNINQAAGNEVYVFPYSLGEFYVGQSVQFKPEDSERFVKFLYDTAGSRRHTLLDFFRL